LFKYKFFFRIGKTIEDSTSFSTCISILVLTPLVVYFILIANTTIKHSQNKTNIQEYDVNARPNLTLTMDNFRLAFRIIFANGTMLSPDVFENYFDFYNIYEEMRQTNNQFFLDYSKTFVFKACNKNDFLDFSEYFDLNLEKAFCLYNHSMNIGGYWDETSIRTFQFGMALCGTLSNKTTCVNQGDVLRDLQDSYIYIYIESQDVDASNYTNPLKKSMKTFFQIIDFTKRKELDFYMQQVQLQTYDNLIYNSEPENQFFNKQFNMVSDSVTHLNTSATISTTIILMGLFSSNTIQQIQRTYMTLVEAGAVVGGISSFVIVLGSLISFLYNDMKIKMKFINHLYDFDMNEERSLKIDKTTLFSSALKPNCLEMEELKSKAKRSSDSELIIPDEITQREEKNIPHDYHTKTSFRKYMGTSNKDFKINEHQAKISGTHKTQKTIFFEKEESKKISQTIYIEKKINLTPIDKNLYDENSFRKDDKGIPESNAKLKFTTCEMILCILFPFCLPHKIKNKYKLYQKGSEYLMKYINIFNLVRMLDEVQKLKSILLNNQQLALFNYISKPTICLADEESENPIIHLKNSFDNKKKEEFSELIRKYYKEIKMKNSWSLIDMRLFDCLDENLKKALKDD